MHTESHTGKDATRPSWRDVLVVAAAFLFLELGAPLLVAAVSAVTR